MEIRSFQYSYQGWTLICVYHLPDFIHHHPSSYIILFCHSSLSFFSSIHGLGSLLPTSYLKAWTVFCQASTIEAILWLILTACLYHLVWLILMTYWRVNICHSFAIKPLLANLMTSWRWVSIRPLSLSQLPWILDGILKMGLCHQTDDILKMTVYHSASYFDWYWWRDWLSHKEGASIASNRQLNLLVVYYNNQRWPRQVDDLRYIPKQNVLPGNTQT